MKIERIESADSAFMQYFIQGWMYGCRAHVATGRVDIRPEVHSHIMDRRPRNFPVVQFLLAIYDLQSGCASYSDRVVRHERGWLT